MTRLDCRLVLDALPDAVVAADGSQTIVLMNAAAERLLGWPASELVGRPLRTIVPPRLREAHAEGFSRYLATREPRIVGQTIRVPALRRDGAEVEVELTLSAARSAEGRELFLASLRGPQHRLEIERELRVLRYLQATTRAAARLGSRLDLDNVLEVVVETLVTDFDSALARVWLYDPAADELVLRASAGLSREVAASSRARIDLKTYPYKVGVVARSRQPFIKNGLEGDPHFDQGWVAREGLAAVAGFPLLGGGELRGVLVSFFRHPIYPEVVEALAAFTSIAAASLNDMRLFAREQEARREAEDQRRRLQTVLDTIPVGVVLAEGPEGHLSLANPAAEEIAGGPIAAGSLAEFARQFPLEAVDGHVYAPEERPLWRTLHLGESVRDTVRYLRPDGRPVVLDITTAPFPGPTGGALTAFRDVTDRLRLESELADRAAQLKALLDHLPVGVAYFDPGAVCRACNGPAARALGRSRRGTLGSHARTVLAGADDLRGALLDAAERAVASTREAVPWVDPEGEEPTRFLDWRFQPLTAEPGESRGALALIVDVTERTRAMEAAEETSRRKTQFLSAVSHDLRTPVNALGLQAELLGHLVAASCEDGGDLRRLASDIRQTSANLVELINDLLDLARFDSGRVEHQPTTFGLSEWLAVTLAPLAALARAKGLDFSWRVDRPDRQARADRVKLGRVLTNLVGNAVKFTESGSVEVSARAAPDGGLALTVGDTGPGVPEDQRERIFDEFAQLRNPERDRTKGTGLGLAICRGLVETVGGRLTVEGRAGGGSLFTAWFPPDHLVSAAAPSPRPPRPEPSPGAADGTVLLVEDEPHSRSALARLLGLEGVSVETAADGPSALAAIERSRPALVLLDLMMPGMDGVEVLRRIRLRPDGADLPVVILTGDVLESRSAELKALGVSGYLSKPVNLDELLAVLVRHSAPAPG